MTSKSMTFRFPLSLAQAIEDLARATGRDRTTVVSEALMQILGLPLPAKAPATIAMLQQQIEQVESSITQLSQQLVALQQTPVDSNDRVLSRPPQTVVEQPGNRPHIERLHPQTALLERILATMTDPVFVCDRAQQLLYINPLGRRSLGLEETTTLQQPIQAFALPPALKAQLATQLEAVFMTGRSITSEISFATPLYGLRDYEYTLSPIQGSIEQIEAVLFNTQDITDRKRTEALLKASEANYQNLFESTNDSILILDAVTRRILTANTNASKRLGYTRQELFQLGIDAILPQGNTDFFELFRRLQTHDISIFNQYLRRKDGIDIPVEVHSRLLEHGDRLVIQSFIRDLSQCGSHQVSEQTAQR